MRNLINVKCVFLVNRYVDVDTLADSFLMAFSDGDVVCINAKLNGDLTAKYKQYSPEVFNNEDDRAVELRLTFECFDDSYTFFDLSDDLLDEFTDGDIICLDVNEVSTNNINEEHDEEQKCVICGKTFTGWGNNAQPVKQGKCCDYCNETVVIPARIVNMRGITEDFEPNISNLDLSINSVMTAYQNANKWLDTVKEFVYYDLGCVFFSSFIHELAHTMPARFDKFGDILHTSNIKVPYPTTMELENEPQDINTVFDVIFICLEQIKIALEGFIKATDGPYHGMACAAESLLNDIEDEYPMLYRMQKQWTSCNNDMATFDKYVGQYVEHKDDLLESLNESILREMSYEKREVIDKCEDLGQQFVKHFDKIYNEIDENTIKHHAAEMQNWLNQAGSYKMKYNNKTPNEKQLYDWFITCGKLPVDLFDNETEAEVYDEFSNTLLDTDRNVINNLKYVGLLNESLDRR